MLKDYQETLRGWLRLKTINCYEVSYHDYAMFLQCVAAGEQKQKNPQCLLEAQKETSIY